MGSNAWAVVSLGLAASLGSSCTFDFAEPFSNAGGTAGASSAGGGASVDEDCTNGLDDDADGFTDCTDSDCGQLACVEGAPEGWEGPLVVLRDDASAPACSDEQIPSVSAGIGLVAGEHSCSECSCEAATGGSCVSAVTVWDGTSVCSATLEATLDMQNTCETFQTSDSQSAAFAPTPVVDVPSSCPAVGGAITKDEASFVEHVTLCGAGAPVGVCGDEQACVAPPQAGEELCIYAEGDVSCPSGGAYAERSVVFRTISDDRACVACSCSIPIDGGCFFTTTLFNAAGCQTASQLLFHDDTCVSLFAGTTYWYMTSTLGPGGSCTASGGGAIGSAALEEPLTLCCAGGS